ncbi:hypothetical protein PROFUN_00336 [Planoprotostelium fungivorum]|uniref:phosphomevalonate kinase n=1 Tax=Planoprotostelium fungivorum TaxID=1890364 RepID=A0A2P6NY69_9EUKA|nr:hypothetical protein PROFUN_00336 [Planoprotostelium fungivorum]
MVEASFCSAPGKVLLTGGYMILQRPNAGLVLSLDARFHSVVKSLERTDDRGTLVIVLSPQFDSRESYRLIFDSGSYHLDPLNGDHQRNPYTENVIIDCISVAHARLGAEHVRTMLKDGLSITILGDNAFYSQKDQVIARGLPLNRKSLQSLPPFLPCSTHLSNMKKTGLGSSAALTTSLTAALLHFFRVIRLVHNVAQLSHCRAQGKVGSGFDVSSAVYGPQRYTRFSPEIIQGILSQEYPTVSQVSKVVEKAWDSEVTPLRLPPGLHLLMGDVSVGSNTPNMVGKVLEWQKRDSSSHMTMRRLCVANDELVWTLEHITKLSEDEDINIYHETLRKCSSVRSEEWVEVTSNPMGQLLFKLRSNFTEIRRMMRAIGEAAAVDIEPSSQRQLADDTMTIPGVLIAGVPGAGGYDAVFALLLDRNAALDVEELWKSRGVVTLAIEEDSVGVASDTAEPQSKL